MTNQRFRVPGALAPRLEEPGVSVPAVLRRDGLAQGTFEQTRIRAALPRFSPEAMRANSAFIARLVALGKKRNATPAQIALAWLLAKKPWIVPIPGTTKLARLDENIGAMQLDLTVDDLLEIDTALARAPVGGDRSPEHLQKLVNG